MVVDCGSETADTYSNGFVLKYHYSAYLAVNHIWQDSEHCRAGCETRFDAMAEFGAEQAICRRAQDLLGDHFRERGYEDFPAARCAMGVILGQPPINKCRAGPKGKSYTECELNWERERWKEFGFKSFPEAFWSGLPGIKEEWRNRTYYAENSDHWINPSMEFNPAMADNGDWKIHYVSRIPKAGQDVVGLERNATFWILKQLRSKRKTRHIVTPDLTMDIFQKGFECFADHQEPWKWKCNYVPEEKQVFDEKHNLAMWWHPWGYANPPGKGSGGYQPTDLIEEHQKIA